MLDLLWRNRGVTCMVSPFFAGLADDGNAMNRFERLFGLKGEARVKFLDGEFQVVSPGDFVT